MEPGFLNKKLNISLVLAALLIFITIPCIATYSALHSDIAQSKAENKSSSINFIDYDNNQESIPEEETYLYNFPKLTWTGIKNLQRNWNSDWIFDYDYLLRFINCVFLVLLLKKIVLNHKSCVEILLGGHAPPRKMLITNR